MKNFAKVNGVNGNEINNTINNNLNNYERLNMVNENYLSSSVVDRDSYISGSIQVLDNGFNMVMSPLDMPRVGGDFDGDSLCSMVHVYNSTGELNVIDIAEFNKNFKCTLESSKTKDNGVVVENYKVDNPVYVDAIDINGGTNNISKKKVTHWSVHKNLHMCKISKRPQTPIATTETFWVSDDHSLVAIEMKTGKVVRINAKTIAANPEKYGFIKFSGQEYASRDNLLEGYGYFTGIWMGDGSVAQGTSAVSLGNENDDIIKAFQRDAKNLLEEIGVADPTIAYYGAYKRAQNANHTHYSDTCITRTRFNNKYISDYLKDNFGIDGIANSGTKNFPFYFANDKDYFVKFFAGFIDTDGSVNKKTIAITSKSYRQIKNLQFILCNKFNVESAVNYVGRVKDDGLVHDYWSITIGVKTFRDFFMQVIPHMLYQDKKDKLQAVIDEGEARYDKYITYVPEPMVKPFDLRGRNHAMKFIQFTEEEMENAKISEELKYLLRLQNEKKIQILPCEYFEFSEDSSHTTGYDFTVEDYCTFTTSDGLFVFDTMAVYPLFSKKANEEARNKMDPRVSKGMWVSPRSLNGCPYKITLDAAASIFTATKE